MKKHLFVLTLILLAVIATTYAMARSIPMSELIRQGELHLNVPINWNIPFLLWGNICGGA